MAYSREQKTRVQCCQGEESTRVLLAAAIETIGILITKGREPAAIRGSGAGGRTRKEVTRKQGGGGEPQSNPNDGKIFTAGCEYQACGAGAAGFDRCDQGGEGEHAGCPVGDTVGSA